MCQARYSMLLKAGRGAAGNGAADALGLQSLREELSSMLRLQARLTTEVRPRQNPTIPFRTVRDCSSDVNASHWSAGTCKSSKSPVSETQSIYACMTLLRRETKQEARRT